ncbi:alpha/beta hydrolase [Kocuria sp.]|uniref:alpha/beta hydrolase n=1 Tax=Kocuria sp. TaxID=1871328 RepID=UPI0026DBE245|nr:alpha/beta hydrolase [Kocuria sp.]MDO4919030.1 alpha/beta hydrolase [Kocuria sp.]
MPLSRRSRTWLRTTAIVVVAVLVVAALALVVWSRTGVMAAEPGPLRSVQEDPAVVVEQQDDAVVLRPAHPSGSSRGLVFYPGAKVEAEAYAARLSGLVTEEGMTVVIPRPWLNLALFDRRDLATFTDLVPGVDEWLVGGHSMGGVRACQVARESSGLLLLGSYCATDLSEAHLPVLSIGGQEDGLSTPQKIADARGELPQDATMVEVPGANHASFGDYGPQAGDGQASISDGQMDRTVTQRVAQDLIGSGR